MLNQTASLKVSISQPYLPDIFQDTPFWIQEGLLIPKLVSVFMGIFFRPTCFSQEQCFIAVSPLVIKDEEIARSAIASSESIATRDKMFSRIVLKLATF